MSMTVTSEKLYVFYTMMVILRHLLCNFERVSNVCLAFLLRFFSVACSTAVSYAGVHVFSLHPSSVEDPAYVLYLY